MPKQYEAMRDKFAKDLPYDKAQEKAAKIYNSKHPRTPVGRGTDQEGNTREQKKHMKDVLKKGK